MTNDFEYSGFIIQKKDKYFAVFKNNKMYYASDSEDQAKKWINQFRKGLSKSLKLKKISDDLILFSPVDQDRKDKLNIVAIFNQNIDSEEKYIKITSKKSGPPVLDIKNLDSNEVIGLMRRAEYMITNVILRNGNI